ncbi:TPA: hypothetical protein ACFRG8_001757 [Neisseria lactamica]
MFTGIALSVENSPFVAAAGVGAGRQYLPAGEDPDCAVWLSLYEENTVCRRTNLPDMAVVWLAGRDFSIKCRLKRLSDGICFRRD